MRKIQPSNRSELLKASVPTYRQHVSIRSIIPQPSMSGNLYASGMSRFLTSLILCAILWLLWSGLFKPLMLAFGAVSCLLVAWISSRLKVVDSSERPLLIFLRMIPYVPWLVKEVVLSNIDVAKRIWQKDMPISPTIMTIPASQKTALGLVIHANSITMTPGTLSIDVEPGEIEVHALAKETLDAMQDGEMDRRVRNLEGKA